MSSTTRRFGTDVSNIPADLRKTPAKKNPVKTQFQSPKPHVTRPISTFLYPTSVSPSVLSFNDECGSLIVDTFNISIDDEITVKSPVKRPSNAIDNMQYDRDFLMLFKEICVEPIEGLIPEVVPGFIHPYRDMEYASPMSKSSKFSTPTKSHIDQSFITPTKLNLSSPIGTSAFNSPAPSSIDCPESPMSLQWRPKKIKKQKPREEDVRRLAARQKQIDIGMNTSGYRRFMETVPVGSRTKAHPKIPDIYQVCSKRSWDGQVRKWRKQLHDYDPPEAAGQIETSVDGLTQQNAAERQATESSSDYEDDSSDIEDHPEEQVSKV